MNTIKIVVGDFTKEVVAPKSWNDLSLKTMALYYETMFTSAGDEFSVAAFTNLKLITMTQTMLGLDMAFMAKWEAKHLQADPQNGAYIFLEELSKIVETCLDGLFEKKEDDEGGVVWSVRFNRTERIYDKLSHSPKAKRNQKPKVNWYYAPADGLSNITLYELAYSFQFYEAYLTTQDEDHVDALIAVLYRPSRTLTRGDRDSGWYGDRRQPLRRHESKIDERKVLSKTLPKLAKRLILFWFASCRESIIQQWPQVFKKGGSGGGSGNHWGDLLLSLAETGVFGNLDQTSDNLYGNAFQLLTKRDNEARELEKNMKKSKK